MGVLLNSSETSVNEQTYSGFMNPEHQVLCFALAQEIYGIPILKVREIQACLAITQIPRSPAYLLGVANLRGAIVPVLDLRTRFALGAMPEDSRPVIVVVEVMGKTVGMRVDGVTDVIDLAPDARRPVPEWGGSDHFSREYLQGLATLKLSETEERMLILLDLDRLLSLEEFQSLEATRT